MTSMTVWEVRSPQTRSRRMTRSGTVLETEASDCRSSRAEITRRRTVWAGPW
jgi:hypothetical protein